MSCNREPITARQPHNLCLARLPSNRCRHRWVREVTHRGTQRQPSQGVTHKGKQYVYMLATLGSGQNLIDTAAIHQWVCNLLADVGCVHRGDASDPTDATYTSALPIHTALDHAGQLCQMHHASGPQAELKHPIGTQSGSAL